ncbi:MAG TPA: DUF4915 domain-containing protein [Candidatus Tectomicrobia bacterium]
MRNDGGVLHTHFRPFAKPMGIAADQARLTIGGTNTVWEYRNVPAVSHTLEPPDKHDACYVPRRLHVTGAIDIHELAYDQHHSSAAQPCTAPASCRSGSGSRSWSICSASPCAKAAPTGHAEEAQHGTLSDRADQSV